MAWSTRELADLAGTSLRTVRHYHDVGLLEEPERRSNGYKSYKVEHLVRLLRIKRLSDLGFPLSQIAEMGEADEYPEQELRTLDAELAATVKRLERVRTELALVLRHEAPTDLPPSMALAAAEADLTEADRSLALVMTRVITPEAQESYTAMMREYDGSPAEKEFDALSADADEPTRRELADRMAPAARDALADHPDLRDPQTMASVKPRRAAETMLAAMSELYNPAQLDVLARIGRALERERQEQGSGQDAAGTTGRAPGGRS